MIKIFLFFILLLGLDSVKHHSFMSLMVHLGLLVWLGLSIFGNKKTQETQRSTDGSMKVSLNDLPKIANNLNRSIEEHNEKKGQEMADKIINKIFNR